MYTKTIGTRAQVWHRTAKRTPGGLTRDELLMNKHGRIVSKLKYNTAKRENRLLKYGYGTKKGKFGFVKLGSRSVKQTRGTRRRGRRGRKMRGGVSAYNAHHSLFQSHPASVH